MLDGVRRLRLQSGIMLTFCLSEQVDRYGARSTAGTAILFWYRARRRPASSFLRWASGDNRDSVYTNLNNINWTKKFGQPGKTCSEAGRAGNRSSHHRLPGPRFHRQRQHLHQHWEPITWQFDVIVGGTSSDMVDEIGGGA